MNLGLLVLLTCCFSKKATPALICNFLLSSAQCTNLLFHSRACIELLCFSDGARLGVPGLKRILGQRFCRTTSESCAFFPLSFLFFRFVVEGESMEKCGVGVE